MSFQRTILPGAKLVALQRARRGRAMDGAQQSRKERKDFKTLKRLSLRPSRLCGKNSYSVGINYD
jgi:hypothetical protein